MTNGLFGIELTPFRVSPFQGWGWRIVSRSPRALPWAIGLCAFGAANLSAAGANLTRQRSNTHQPRATPWDRSARILFSPERAKPHDGNRPTQNIIVANVAGILEA